MSKQKQNNIGKKKRALFKQGHKFVKKNDWYRATLAYMDLWELDHKDENNLILLSQALTKIGARDKAIYVLEKALEVNGPKQEILTIIGGLANSMEMFDISEKLHVQFMKLHPTDPSAYFGYAEALGGQDRFQESVDFLQQIIPQFPLQSEMWNILAAHLFKQGRITDSLPFYLEALNLSDQNFAIYNNLALVSEYLGHPKQSLEYAEKALECEPDHPEPRMGKALRLLSMGEFKEGWELYEARLDLRKSGCINYTVDLPAWQGEDLKDKTILLRSEQGVGDEVFFAHLYLPIFKMAKKVIIGCEKRLEPLFKRSFPDADIYFHASGKRTGYYFRGYPDLDKLISEGKQKIDYAVPIAGVSRHLYDSPTQIEDHPDGIVTPDPKQLEKWKKRFAKIGKGKKVGILWKSMITGKGRDIFYYTLDQMLPFLKVPGIEFINLQYTDCEEEIQNLETKHGIKIHRWEDIDLKDDLDQLTAYISNLDLVIGPASTPSMFSASLGVPVWWALKLTPWWLFGNKKYPPFFSKGRVITCGVEDEWDETMDLISKRLEKFVKTGDPLQD